ncbi:related to ornithine aminotransferase [Saccharomycodes ludwigii]|uniref:Related to ornithine aminotransferase n=1 Tax=Saccharomycodes ludwigii TaxID=36035 RepID=A0A376B867_9ASCO|nr:hypothetical protein SCDLUD_002644 [Saccharomycodes ludwigii]KAH3901161.1 hypothetical protein SCDLUD_002644 [Saccharomycodes ludwigii]SSD60821.1 related to ornithine aminotransferase [Saccharomycodes ludwigii]
MTISKNQESYVFQCKISETPAQVIGGKGTRITVEKDGKVYEDILDGVTGAAVGALGWGDEYMVGVVTDAVKSSTYSYPSLMGNKESEELAKFYIDHSPKGTFASALWCCSGSEANENCMKIMYQYWLERGKTKKTKFISRMTSYHGFTIGALSLSENARADDFRPILLPKTQCLKMPVCYPYRFQKKGQTEAEYVQELLDALEKLIVDNDPETIISVTVETLPGSSLGTVPPPKGYLPGIRALCNKYDILMHLDEVMCGTGRSNPNGGLNCWENFMPLDQGPDLQTVGKTLGSGYATIAGVLVSPKVRNAYINGSNQVLGAHTYSSHAFNCKVALGVQKKLIGNGLTKNIFEMGNLMGKTLKEKLLSEDNIVGDVRGIGGFWSIELVKDRETKAVFDPKLDLGHRLHGICFQNGLNVMGMQGCVNQQTNEGDFITLAPSFIITKDDVDEIVKRAVKSVNDLTAALKKEGEF